MAASLPAIAVAGILSMSGPRLFVADEGGGGDGITVRGSGFGTKSAPLVYDDFETGTAGELVSDAVAVIGAWLDTGDALGRYNASQARAGSQSVLHSYRSAGNVFTTHQLVRADFRNAAYFAFWYRLNYIDNISRNHKVYRVWDGPFGGGNGENGDLVFWCNGDGYVTFGPNGDWTPAVSPGSHAEDQWIYIEGIFRSGVVFELNRGGQELYGETGAGVGVNGTETSQDLMIGHYWALDGITECPDTNSGADIWLDNIYVDNSVQRVVLDNGTIMVPQPFDSWSDTEIVISEPNYAGLSGTVTLRVYNANNSQVHSESVVVP